MRLLLLGVLLLIPLPALAQVSLPSPPPHHPPPEGVIVIPDGNGGVIYGNGRGGTDAYTAGVIGQGLIRQFR